MDAPSSEVASKADANIGVRLQCPRCQADIDGLLCPSCSFEMRIQHGIVHALQAERVAHYAQFIEDYERIREAEGRGSDGDDFYLGLPYKDASGRNSGQWKIRARSFDYLSQRILKRRCQGGNGLILDLGAGNGWMSYRLALAGYKPVAVDLLTNDRDGLGAAMHYRKYLPELFPRIQAEISRLPFQADQFDAIVFNASFHYAEDYEVPLREALRCVRRNGLVIISDTPWYSQEESGIRMISERNAAFRQRYGTASDATRKLEFLTDERLRLLEKRLSIRWTVHRPFYGFKWAARPLIAKLRNQREPSKFRIYVAQKNT